MITTVVSVGVFGTLTYQDNFNNGDENVDGIEKFETNDSLEEFVNAEDNSFFSSLAEDVVRTGEESLQPTNQPVAETTDSLDVAADSGSGGTSSGDNSYSTQQTNVQVVGIDEPDSVKLTEESAYYSPPRNSYRIPVTPLPGPVTGGVEPTTDIAPPKPPERVDDEIKVISTEETEIPEVVNQIDHKGKMLRSGDNLVIFDNNKITGHDISDSENPSKEWEKSLSDRTSIETARASDGEIFFIFNTHVDDCPVEPVDDEEVNCEDVYYPTELDSGSGVYSVLTMNSESGDTTSSTSFVGSNRDTTVYMSQENLYISYQTDQPLIEEFINQEVDELNVSQNAKEDIKEIDTEEVGNRFDFRRKVTEILTDENNTDYRDRRDAMRKVLLPYEDFIGENAREAQKTIIVRVGLNDNISPEAVGTVPGYTLNQYSFGEHDDNLRIATTVPASGTSESVNDMYVLGQESLEIRGSVQDMAEGQRVYAVRFIDDKGYIITFRQVDPLHVIDIENPADPVEVGTLKLPGFSDYLHKIGDGKLLGIGESENRRAKIVLFDVSDETDPQVSDSVVIENEYGTRISEDFRSFLEDDKTGVYYIPADNGVYVIEEQNGELDLVETVETPTSAERVRIVGEDLYIFHSTGVLSVDRETYDMNEDLLFDEIED